MDVLSYFVVFQEDLLKVYILVSRCDLGLYTIDGVLSSFSGRFFIHSDSKDKP